MSLNRGISARLNELEKYITIRNINTRMGFSAPPARDQNLKNLISRLKYILIFKY
jgi:hypothetical protein